MILERQVQLIIWNEKKYLERNIIRSSNKKMTANVGAADFFFSKTGASYGNTQYIYSDVQQQ